MIARCVNGESHWQVEVLNERDETEEEKQLASEVADLLRNTIRLNVKMQVRSQGQATAAYRSH